MNLTVDLPAVLAARHEPIDLLSDGAGGLVVVCRDRRLDRKVVLKILSTTSDDEDDPATRSRETERLKREIAALIEISHPRVVRVFDAGIAEDRPYYVMELLDGPTLRNHITAMERLDRTEALSTVAAIGEALQVLEERRMLHRDIKPQNVIIDRERGPVLIDLGLVKRPDYTQGLTQTRSLLGTPLYVAPEIVLGNAADLRSDVYSLGVVLHEMLAGQPPFTGVVRAVLLAHVNDAPPRIDGLAEDLQELVDRMLSKDPLDRPQTLDELQRLVGGLLTTRPGPEDTTGSRATRSPGGGGLPVTKATPASSAEATGASTFPVRVEPPRPAASPRSQARRLVAGSAFLVALVLAIGLHLRPPRSAPVATPAPPRIDEMTLEASGVGLVTVSGRCSDASSVSIRIVSGGARVLGETRRIQGRRFMASLAIDSLDRPLVLSCRPARGSVSGADATTSVETDRLARPWARVLAATVSSSVRTLEALRGKLRVQGLDGRVEGALSSLVDLEMLRRPAGPALLGRFLGDRSVPVDSRLAVACSLGTLAEASIYLKAHRRPVPGWLKEYLDLPWVHQTAPPFAHARRHKFRLKLKRPGRVKVDQPGPSPKTGPSGSGRVEASHLTNDPLQAELRPDMYVHQIAWTFPCRRAVDRAALGVHVYKLKLEDAVSIKINGKAIPRCIAHRSDPGPGGRVDEDLRSEDAHYVEFPADLLVKGDNLVTLRYARVLDLPVKGAADLEQAQVLLLENE
ncbi:MAG: serine/threonine protein kinase [Candidatus Riflebacteria bacterium]|nr:serine/threonine protein kinase [Candidatus Riflebacteria bacterium]